MFYSGKKLIINLDLARPGRPSLADDLIDLFESGDFIFSNTDRLLLWNNFLQSDENTAPIMSVGPSSSDDSKLIKVDCERTRSQLEFFREPETRQMMEYLLLHFCKIKNIRYRQGMNEVLAPFVAMKNQMKLNWQQISGYFQGFMSRHLLHSSTDPNFLKRACVLSRSLLRFHVPKIASKLDEAGMFPEMYAVPWFITVFSYKLDIETTLKLWDFVIAEDDPSFVFFLSVSLVIQNANSIAESIADKTRVSHFPH
jgi:Rab-GTPase-TBC domain